MNNNDNVINQLTNLLQKHFEEQQLKPHQYVVGIYNKHTNKLIGYHLSTLCQVTQEITQAKRYNGENPYKQLETIWKNISYLVETQDFKDKLFGDLFNEIKNKHYNKLTSKDIYIDAIYLNSNMPKQQFRYQIL